MKRLMLLLPLVAVVVIAASTLGARAIQGPIRVGAAFPLSSGAGSLAAEELRGVEIARDLVNADGGVTGRPIELIERDLSDRARAQEVIDGHRSNGAVAILGAYASDLSMVASTAADHAGVVYWEAGAVADQLTGRGLPLVFRVGAVGSVLGTNSATFAATELAPRLRIAPARMRVAIVEADDDYARSVAGGAERAAVAHGLQVVLHASYDMIVPDWAAVFRQLRAVRPDVVILASHVPDGIAFRAAMVKDGFKTGALIGSTMAECGPEFGAALGADAVGVFASDRPTAGFNPGALNPTARATYDRFATEWQRRFGGAPSEEGIAGFSAAWALFHETLPRAAAGGTIDAATISAAARSLDLPVGSLPNGAGLHFSPDPGTLGQNERAAAVIWQWQGIRQSVTVWPPVYATGQITDVPLPR
jgi:branched-chain amino acid transport system substrate-binding protein